MLFFPQIDFEIGFEEAHFKLMHYRKYSQKAVPGIHPTFVP